MTKAPLIALAMYHMTAAVLCAESSATQPASYPQAADISQVLCWVDDAKVIRIEGWAGETIQLPQVITDTGTIRRLSSAFRAAQFQIDKEVTRQFRQGDTISAAQHLDILVDCSNLVRTASSDLLVCDRLLTYRASTLIDGKDFADTIAVILEEHQERLHNHAVETIGDPGSPQPHR